MINAHSIYTYNHKIKRTHNKKIPLHKGRDNEKILYVSGIALQVSKSHNSQPMEVANSIVSYLSKTCDGIFSIRIVPPGWIHLEVSPPFTASWLQNIAMGSLEEGGKAEEANKESINSVSSHVFQTNSQCPMTAVATSRQSGPTHCLPHAQIHNLDHLFTIQHAHARCCSLVLLAHREGLIKLREPLPDTSPAFWSVIFPEQIPWLNCDGKLCLNHPDESRLITELVQVVDAFECKDVGSWEKAGLNLSQAWENFWCKCRFWGEVKTLSPELAQARVGLLMTTQSVLRFLLVEKLGVLALMEL
ncbi:glutamate acetyltransferase [Halotia branconii]|uniref:Glutamate acetyltransferase n=1 Tax=Halotia branconii CENA392 TaxID=1539056 RepID=A0AAJ6PC05_9CYAN|nr:glutamate acetyltransferase [Halotia branconii]WGV28291.1 glutamate acetyltransferase [Halotia branconii CENA392]